ncbi:hypothetical protein DH2020_012484 [Rehmannia glutinosa]|uniref:60S acidic ribosomal protein n=1 Tax=Rehmannia glutinosa TaxID=99300 RepID=A0ABR0X305_REHGL
MELSGTNSILSHSIGGGRRSLGMLSFSGDSFFPTNFCTVVWMLGKNVGWRVCLHLYASLILHDDGIAITAKEIATLVKAANLTVESYWPSLFAKHCEKRNIEDLVMNVGSGSGVAVAVVAPAEGASGGTDTATAPAVEEKKEEPK